jgi:glycosyltransferase involved in cell wall biosynthesis
MKLTIIIPVYNEVRTVGELVRRVQNVPVNKEVIVINDASSDGTGEILERMEDIEVIHFSVNKGKGTAVAAGLKRCTGDLVIVQDADLEYDPNDYPRLMQPIIERSADAVYGSRFKGGGKFLFRFWLANKIFVFITNFLFGARLSDVLTCFRCMRRDLLQEMNLESKRFEIETEITAKLLRRGLRIVEVPISYCGRIEGKKINVLDGIKILVVIAKLKFF